MIQPFTHDDFALLREALNALRAMDNHAINLAARARQSGGQVRQLAELGSRGRHIDAVDCLLREAHARLTGMPTIQHSNADLHDAANEPLSHAAEAREANVRG